MRPAPPAPEDDAARLVLKVSSISICSSSLVSNSRSFPLSSTSVLKLNRSSISSVCGKVQPQERHAISARAFSPRSKVATAKQAPHCCEPLIGLRRGKYLAVERPLELLLLGVQAMVHAGVRVLGRAEETRLAQKVCVYVGGVRTETMRAHGQRGPLPRVSSDNAGRRGGLPAWRTCRPTSRRR